MNTPLAYFLTFTCYGTWLHGDDRGSVDREHNSPGTPVLPPDGERKAREDDDLAEPPYQLDAPRRQVTLRALCEIARRKGWMLHAVHVRSNHVHMVVTADGTAERVLNDFKSGQPSPEQGVPGRAGSEALDAPRQHSLSLDRGSRRGKGALRPAWPGRPAGTIPEPSRARSGAE